MPTFSFLAIEVRPFCCRLSTAVFTASVSLRLRSSYSPAFPDSLRFNAECLSRYTVFPSFKQNCFRTNPSTLPSPREPEPFRRQWMLEPAFRSNPSHSQPAFSELGSRVARPSTFRPVAVVSHKSGQSSPTRETSQTTAIRNKLSRQGAGSLCSRLWIAVRDNPAILARLDGVFASLCFGQCAISNENLF